MTDHCRGLGQFLSGVVVVSNDQIHTQLRSQVGLSGRADAAIYCDDQVHAALSQFVQGFVVQPIAFVKAIGDMPIHVRAQGRQHLHQQGGGGHAVHIVVAIHDYLFLLIQRI